MDLIKNLTTFSLATVVSVSLSSFMATAAKAEPPANLSATGATEEPYLPETAYDEYMRLGFDAQQSGDYVSAANYFRYALFAIPQDREATTAYWNARAQLQNGDLPARTQAYNDAMEAGYDATEDGDYAQALGYFQSALSLRPADYYAAQAIRNVQTYINRGVGADSPSDVDLTYTVYLNEPLYDRYMRLGYAAAQREDFLSAREYFRSALYDRPNDRQATVAYWNAVDALKDGEFGLNETAESDYDRFMGRGYDATERGDYARAIRFFEQALTERPADGYAIQALRNVRTYLDAES
ncbi:MAG: hypothetical protein AAFP20_11535 [Cyanobacteria bacterium J06614_10]